MQVAWRVGSRDDNTTAPAAAGKQALSGKLAERYPLPDGRHQSFNEQEGRGIANTRRRALRWKEQFLMKIVVGVNCLTTVQLSAIVILTP